MKLHPLGRHTLLTFRIVLSACPHFSFIYFSLIPLQLPHHFLRLFEFFLLFLFYFLPIPTFFVASSLFQLCDFEKKKTGDWLLIIKGIKVMSEVPNTVQNDYLSLSTIIFPFLEEIICGQKYHTVGPGNTTSNVNLYSPYYPDTYPRNNKCSWFITAYDDKYIIFQFPEFKTKEYRDTFDIGEGYYESWSSKVFSIDGEWAPNSVTVQSAAWIAFRAGGLDFEGRFQLHISWSDVFSK